MLGQHSLSSRLKGLWIGAKSAVPRDSFMYGLFAILYRGSFAVFPQSLSGDDKPQLNSTAGGLVTPTYSCPWEEMLHQPAARAKTGQRLPAHWEWKRSSPEKGALGLSPFDDQTVTTAWAFSPEILEMTLWTVDLRGLKKKKKTTQEEIVLLNETIAHFFFL